MSEVECPSENCSMCSGEYCAIHHHEGCDCDVIDRHGIKIMTNPTKAEQSSPGPMEISEGPSHHWSPDWWAVKINFPSDIWTESKKYTSDKHRRCYLFAENYDEVQDLAARIVDAVNFCEGLSDFRLTQFKVQELGAILDAYKASLDIRLEELSQLRAELQKERELNIAAASEIDDRDERIDCLETELTALRAAKQQAEKERDALKDAGNFVRWIAEEICTRGCNGTHKEDECKTAGLPFDEYCDECAIWSKIKELGLDSALLNAGSMEGKES